MNNDAILSALMNANYIPSVELLMNGVSTRIDAAQRSLGVRPVVEDADRAVQNAADNLQTFVNAATRVELLTLRPTPPHVIAFINESIATLRKLNGEVRLCKFLTSTGDARDRNPRTEN